MGKDSTISWTEHTFNPWWGCTAVSPGCDNCFAEAFDKRVGGAHWGRGRPRREFGDAHWGEPLKWNKTGGHVFCMSMGDVMDDEAPEGARERLWALIDATPNLRWLLLTKRPHRYRRYLPVGGFMHDNVMLGATTENQKYYDVRMPILVDAARDLRYRRRPFVRTAARVLTFASYEPALGAISFDDAPTRPMSGIRYKPDWLIFGGETGAGRRPMEVAWAESMRDQCAQQGVSFWMKQMSARTPGAASDLIPANLLIRNRPEAF